MKVRLNVYLEPFVLNNVKAFADRYSLSRNKAIEYLIMIALTEKKKEVVDSVLLYR